MFARDKGATQMMAKKVQGRMELARAYICMNGLYTWLNFN